MDPRDPKERAAETPTEIFQPTPDIPPTLPVAQGDTKHPVDPAVGETMPVVGSDETVPLNPQVNTPTVRSQPANVRRFGEYDLLEEIARGGMGVIYRARQRGLNRVVALKMILTGQFADKDEIHRFQVEAEAAAALNHAGIVPIFEVGQVDGQHFFSMGLVEGDSLALRLVQGPLAPKVAAELVAQVADAVHYAHRQGVIHRDIKPANILLDKGDEPRITDFGLAKRMEADSNLTASGQVLGTPNYMPPEQALGMLDEIGPCSDVYALGGVLYATLTGRSPFFSDNPVETLRQVIDDEPVSPRVLNPTVPRDLETITLKCLQKDPRKRYPSADDLANDLRRFARGEPIAARPTSRLERMWSWSRRQPVIASLILLLVISICAGFGVSWYFAIEAGNRAVEAEQFAGKSEENLKTAKANEKLANDKSRLAKAQAKRADNEASKAREAEKRERERREYAESLTRLANAHRLAAQAREVADRSPQQALLLAVESLRIRENEGDPPVIASRQAIRHVLSKVGGRVIYRRDDQHSLNSMALLPDNRLVLLHHWAMDFVDVNAPAKSNKIQFDFSAVIHNFNHNPARLVTSDQNGSVQIWDWKSIDPQNGKPLLQLPKTTDGKVTRIGINRDGTRLARGNTDNSVEIWDLTSDRPDDTKVMLPKQETRVSGLDFSPNNRWLAINSFGESNLQLWDWNADPPVQKELQLKASRVQFSANNRWLVGQHFGTIAIFDLQSDDPSTPHKTLEYPVMPRGFLCSTNERWMAIALDTGEVELWDMNDEPQKVHTLQTYSTNVGRLAFSPDRRWLAAAFGDNKVKVWNLTASPPSSQSRTLSGHEGFVSHLAFRHDGRGLYTAARDKTVRYWDLSLASNFASPASIKRSVRYEFDSMGSRLHAYDVDQGVQFWHIDSNRVALEEKRQFKPLPSTTQHSNVEISPDGKWLVQTNGSKVTRWDLTAQDSESTAIELSVEGEHLMSSEIGPNSRWLVAVGRKSLYLWQINARQPTMTFVNLNTMSYVPTSHEFSPDGRWFCAGTLNRQLFMWDLNATDIASSRWEIPVPKTSEHRTVVAWSAFSADSRSLAISCVPFGFFVWRIDGNNATIHIQENEISDATHPIEFSSDKVCRLKKGEILLWPLEGDRPEPTKLPRIGEYFSKVTISPNGQFLATSDRSELRLWDLTSKDPAATSIVLHKSARPIQLLKFSPDSRWLRTWFEGDPTIKLWHVRTDDLVELAKETAGRSLTDAERAEYQIE